MKASGGHFFLIRALVGIIAVSIGLMPAAKVLADQVLEIPQMAAPVSHDADDSFAPTATHDYRHHEPEEPGSEAPLPANLGSLEDYQHQGEEDRRSSPYASSNFPGNGFGGGNNGAVTVEFGPGNSRDALTTNIIMGAVVLGLFAMELSPPHHR